MKKAFFIGLVALIATTAAFADHAVLLDFNILTADDGEGNNVATTIDVSDYTTYDLSAQNKPVLKTSLAIERWDVELAPSARFAPNENNSFVKEVISNGPDGARNVMGVRILFPKDQINSYAKITPEFDIPVWAEKDGNYLFQDKNIGVVMNVGCLKEVTFRVCGRNYTHSVQLILEVEGRHKIIDMGSLDFVGWRTLKWTNPHYLRNVKDRTWVNNPVYPGKMPYVKFIGIQLVKDLQYEGGDFVVYFDKIEIDYDKAYIDTEFDIDDEAVWGIQGEWQRAVEANEFKNLGKKQTKLYLEQQKLDASNENNGKN